MLAHYYDDVYPPILWGVRRLVSWFGWVCAIVVLVVVTLGATPVATSWFGTITAETLGGDALLLGGVFLFYVITDMLWMWGYGLWQLWCSRHDGWALLQQWRLWIAMMVSLIGVSWVLVTLLHIIIVISSD